MCPTWQYEPYDNRNTLQTSGQCWRPEVFGLVKSRNLPYGASDQYINWLLMDGEYLYFGTENNIYKLNVNGPKTWDVTEGAYVPDTESYAWIQNVGSAAAILSDDGSALYSVVTIAAGSDNCYLYAFHTSDGTKLFDAARVSSLTGTTANSAPWLDNDGNIHVLFRYYDGAAGDLRWSKLNGTTGEIITEVSTVIPDDNPDKLVVSKWPISLGNIAYNCAKHGGASKEQSYLLEFNNVTMATPAKDIRLKDHEKAPSFLIKDHFAYIAGTYGTYKIDLNATPPRGIAGGYPNGWFTARSVTSTNVSPMCISPDGTLYYMCQSILYAYNQNGNEIRTTTLQFNSDPSPTLPAPVIDSESYIYVLTNNDSASNNFYTLTPTFGKWVQQNIGASTTRYATNNPILANNTLYFSMYDTTGSDGSYIYMARAVWSPPEPAPGPITTTTTSTTPTTTTTTTTGTGTTTTTTTTATPTTTTTTTTPPALSKVITTFAIEVTKASTTTLEVTQETNASNAENTKSTVFSESMTFGSIAPGETSKTIVAQLNIPNVKAITNIKLGLISTGSLTFANNIFGVTSNYELISGYPIENYFQGVNSNESASNAYNISIPNKNNYSSDYVYLNINLPSNNIFGTSVLRYKWFFEYA